MSDSFRNSYKVHSARVTDDQVLELKISMCSFDEPKSVDEHERLHGTRVVPFKVYTPLELGQDPLKVLSEKVTRFMDNVQNGRPLTP